MSLLGFEPRLPGIFPTFLRGLEEQSEETLSFGQAFLKGWSEAESAIRYSTGPRHSVLLLIIKDF